MEDKSFHDLYFGDHQVEYIVSLSHCFFLRIKFHSQQAYSEFYIPRNHLCIYTIHIELVAN